MLALACLALALALLPAALAGINLGALRRPLPDPGTCPRVSILIPARNEASIIAGTVRAALASVGVDLEICVGDDHSTDETAAIVRALAAADARVRLVAIPPLLEGWTGKNHACAHLVEAARGNFLLFVDADVTLAPEAAAALAAHATCAGAALVSGVPCQRIGSLGEALTVPMIGFLLAGYLPVPMMRASLRPSLGAACGQLVLVDRAAYEAVGGHGAIRARIHDGVFLPRLLRAAGYRTDLVAGRDLATCRMYVNFDQAWAGFSKNAHEGMATARALPLWTLLLFGGHVMPVLLLGLGLLGFGSVVASGLSAAAFGLSLATRAVITRAGGEPVWTIPLHPLAVLVALAIQWNVLLRPRRSGAALWKGRSYPLGGA